MYKGQGDCATLERNVPKDCIPACATLPKRLGKKIHEIFFTPISLKLSDLLVMRRLMNNPLAKVGMSVALQPFISSES